MERLLMLKMERMKRQMIKLAKQKGLDHPEVLRISQQIDWIHNRLNSLSVERQDNPYLIRRHQDHKIMKETIKSAYLAVSGI